MFKNIILRDLRSFQFLYAIRKNSSHSQPTKYPKRIFSGIQPTGAIHLGNYLGAIKQWVKIQDEERNGIDITLSIVDLHSITLPYQPKQLSQNILEMTATLLACGIDPKRITLFQQSTVPQHTELYWYLSCISTMARLNHLPQFKEKSANLKDIPLGLYIYPVLQAADILLHKATHVPVGDDQLQHLQLTRELAKMFNSRFGNTFPIPEVVITEAAKIRSLRNPTKKMSKSDKDQKSCIYLTDSKDEITRKIKKAVTDLTSEVTYDPDNRLGITNLINIHSAVSGKSQKEICKESEGISTGEYKFQVADAVNTKIGPIREKYEHYLNDPQYLLNILEDGTEKAMEYAEKTLIEVRYNLGVRFKLDKVQMKVNKIN